MKIDSISNQKVKQWAKLQQKKYRDSEKLFLVENEHLIQEAFKANIVTHLLLAEGTQNPFAMEAIYCSPEVMRKLSQNVSVVKMIAVCKQLSYVREDNHRLILLDNVQDPGNVGTIIRTAYSFGFDAVIMSNDCVDLYNDKVIRSTQGAMFYMPIIRKDLLKEIECLKQEQVTIIATALSDKTVCLSAIKPQAKLALIVGNEGQGVNASLQEAADILTKIEMNGFDSLNVAIAAGICMYNFRKIV